MFRYKTREYLLTAFTVLIFFIPIASFSEEANNNSENDSGVPLEDVQRFSNAISQIKKYYVKPVSDQELFDNAIRGMLSGLDPHSAYLNEQDFTELQTATNGEFGGLGIEVTMEDGIIRVITPLVGTPAGKAGIKPGDYIIKLGDRAVQGLSLQDAVNIMRGKIGSNIDLTIIRKGTKQPLNFSLVREKIMIESVQSKLLDKQFGYVRLTQFQALTNQDMIKAVHKMQELAGGKLKGLILDLRNNPGGLLDSAIQISDAFLAHDKSGQPEKIVFTKGRVAGSKFTAFATPGDIINNAPMVVLINNGSASASEIVAGALKDNKRALIVGTKSFGKGSVQTVLPLDDKRGIKLTTALYYTPSGSSIQAKGIEPDVVVDELIVPKSKQLEKPAGFSEATLKGHLLSNKTEKISKNLSESDEEILHNDFQLYSALTILKGMALAQK